MSVLKNYVDVIPGVAKRVRFSELHLEDRETVDPDSKLTKQARVLAGTAVWEDGQSVNKPFSTMSEGLAGKLVPYIGDPNLQRITFSILRTGTGYKTQYTVGVS